MLWGILTTPSRCGVLVADVTGSEVSSIHREAGIVQLSWEAVNTELCLLHMVAVFQWNITIFLFWLIVIDSDWFWWILLLNWAAKENDFLLEKLASEEAFVRPLGPAEVC